MAYTKVQLKDMFQSSFDLQKWTDFIIDFFKAREVYRTPEQIAIDPSEGRGYVLGYLDTSDTYRISFFYLKLKLSQSVVLYILAKNPQKSSSFGHKYGKIWHKSLQSLSNRRILS